MTTSERVLLCCTVLWLPLCGLSAARETQSLDGQWEIAFDAGNVGRAAGWHRADVFQGLKIRRPITVPSCWELIEKDYEGVAFFQHDFTVPAAWRDRVVRLQFDAVNFRAEVWLNGTAIGVHEGGFTPFEFRVEDVLKFGSSNTLALRVVGPVLMSDKEIDGMGPMETTQWRGGITGGIWQSVRLVATGQTLVSDVFIEPDLSDSSASLTLELEQTGAATVTGRVEIAVRSKGKLIAEDRQPVILEPGRHQQRHVVKIPDAVHWSPESPHLYSIDVSVTRGQALSDRWSTRFGMREFTIRDKQFYLNGKPLYLKATFFEGLYPGKVAYPDSREMAIREIQLARDAGFNMIRPWRKPPPPMWLDLCDEMGVLTVGSLAVECMDFPFESVNLPRWVENEVRESILRDRNRTCVVQWELFNELKRPVLMRMLHPMAMLARELDPTRLILDESGGWAQGANMFLPYQSVPMQFNDIHDYPGPQVSAEVYRKLILTGDKTHKEMRSMGLKGRLPGRNVIPGLMSFFSELGYGSLPDLVSNNRQFAEEGNPITPAAVCHRRLADNYRRVLKESGFDRIYPDFQKFCLDEQVLHGRANKLMIEAVRCNPKVIGYCVHALTAGDWIMGAGLIDLWRNPKTAVYEDTGAANQPRIAAIRVWPRNVYAGSDARIEVTGVNEKTAIQGRLEVTVVSKEGKTVLSKTEQVELKKGIAPLFSHALATGSLKGTYTVKALFTAGSGDVITENAYAFDVFAVDQVSVPRKRIAVYDPWNALKPFLKKPGIEFSEFEAGIGTDLPVFVSRTDIKHGGNRKRFVELAAFAKRGGTVVYLGGGGERYGWGKPVAVPDYLPVKCGTKLARGTWQPITHLVQNHPIFEGLPSGQMMGSVYENVWAERSLVGAGGELVAGCIGFDWFPELDKRRRHYYGPGDTWYGSDVAVVPVGEGRCVLSQLRLIDQLGQDPVADKILYNLIEWAANGDEE